MTTRARLHARLSRIEAKTERLARAVAAGEVKFNPLQPRIPAGRTDGGQWTSGHGGGDPARNWLAVSRAGRTPARVEIDRTGEEAWRAMATSRSPAGDEIRTIDMRDGAHIHALTPAPGSAAPFDSRYDVRTPDGRTTTFENNGPTQTIRDEAGNILSRTTLTPEGLVAEPVVMAAAFSREHALRGALDVAEAAARSLFSGLSIFNRPGSTAVMAIESADGSDSTERTRLWTDRLTARELTEICPRAPLVQEIANQAMAEITREQPNLYGGRLGDEVHERARQIIKELRDPFLEPELTIRRAETDPEPRRNSRDSVRLDVLEYLPPDAACIYDFKTGRDGITDRRFNQLRNHAEARWPDVRRIRIIEVRPGR